jgi:hypothetical protein
LGGKCRVTLPPSDVGVDELVGVPALVAAAHGDPVLNFVAAVILVAKDRVLAVVAALAVFDTPE